MHTPGERERERQIEKGRESERAMGKHLTYACAAQVAHTPTHTHMQRYLWDCGHMGMFVLIVGVLLIEYADANMQVPCADLWRRLCVCVCVGLAGAGLVRQLLFQQDKSASECVCQLDMCSMDTDWSILAS